MARVTVTYRGQLAEHLGTREEQLEASTVRDILKHLKATQTKEVYRTAKAMMVAINGLSIVHLDVFDTPLCNGDVVAFMPLAAGG